MAPWRAFLGSITLLLMASGTGSAAAVLKTGIQKHPMFDTWFLTTERTSYVVGATTEGYFLNLHWGERLTQMDDLQAVLENTTASQNPPITAAPEELPIFGGLRYLETALNAELPNGVRELNLLFTGDVNITGNTLMDVNLRDGNYSELLVTLHYELDIENDIIRRSYTVRNGLNGRVNLSKVFSAAWHPPTSQGIDDRREVITLAGEW